MTIRSWLGMAAGAALFAAGAQAQSQDGTHEKSPTVNNSANRADDPTAGENDRFNAVPGGKATPREEWKKGDSRGKPQDTAKGDPHAPGMAQGDGAQSGASHERERAKENAKNRGKVTKPAGKAIGSGGPAGKATRPGKNYGRKPSPHAGGVATGAEAPAGAAHEGTAGKEDKK